MFCPLKLPSFLQDLLVTVSMQINDCIVGLCATLHHNPVVPEQGVAVIKAIERVKFEDGSKIGNQSQAINSLHLKMLAQ